jgi:hypothetical protein
MRATHWTAGDQRKPAPDGLLWRASCGRWVRLADTGTPYVVTCKQCRRYLQRLTDNER